MNFKERYETIILAIGRGIRANARFSSTLPQTVQGMAGQIAKVFIELVDSTPVPPGFVDGGDWQHKARIERAALSMLEARLQTTSPEGIDDPAEIATLVQEAYGDSEYLLYEVDNPSNPPVLQGGSV